MVCLKMIYFVQNNLLIETINLLFILFNFSFLF